MGKWIVQQMPKNPPARMPAIELACEHCGYRVRYEPGFDPYQPVPAGQFACPFCCVKLTIRAEHADHGLTHPTEAIRAEMEARKCEPPCPRFTFTEVPDAQDRAEEDGPQEG